jgi:hypothetical protein
LDQLNRVRDLAELAIPPGNRLERLRGDRIGQNSIRINDQNEIIRGRRSVTPDTALRLAQVLGMSADFWLGLQQDWDLWHAERSEKAATIGQLQPLRNAS